MDQEAQAVDSMGAPIEAIWAGAELANPPLRVAATDFNESGRLRDSFALAQLQLLDRIHLAAAVLDRDEQIVGFNCRCERVFGSGLTRQGNRIVAKDRASSVRLRKAIRAVFSYQSRAPAQAGSGFIHREPEPPIVFRVLPLDLSPVDGRPRQALLIFSSPHLQSVADAGFLAQAFGLTPAQGRLARHLAAGASLDSAALRLGVKKETARNHLKQIFLRTGTCRQGELVAVLSACWLAAQENGPEAAERQARLART